MFLVNLHFLTHSERIWRQAQKLKCSLFKQEYPLTEKAGRQVRSFCPGFLWQAGCDGHSNEAVEYSLRKQEFGGHIHIP